MVVANRSSAIRWSLTRGRWLWAITPYSIHARAMCSSAICAEQSATWSDQRHTYMAQRDRQAEARWRGVWGNGTRLGCIHATGGAVGPRDGAVHGPRGRSPRRAFILHDAGP